MDSSYTCDVKVDLSLNGIITTMSGFWTEQTVSEWSTKFMDCYSKNFANKSFKVLADMRGYKPATKEVQDEISEIQANAKKMNLIASAVVTDSFLSLNQMKRIAKETGVGNTEDYFTNYDEAYNWLKEK